MAFSIDLPVLAALVVGMALSVFSLWFFNREQPPKTVLDGTTWFNFPLTKKIVINHNTAIYRFSLPKATDTLGLPIGQHIQIQSLIAATGKTLTRSYTPTSSDEDKGHFDLLIKSYELGNISKVVGQMQIGDKLKIKGPKGHFVYRNGLAKHLSMIAGGTGITPMLQIIRAITRDEDDKTTVSLLYANVSESDILLKAELDEAVAQSNGRLKVHYVLNNPPAGWNGGVGFVSKEMIEERCGAALEDESSKMLMCGPPPMLTAMKVHLSDLGYPAPRLLSKLEDKVFCF